MLSAGFLLIRSVPRPQWLAADLLPETVISASRCICPRFPDAYAIAWCTMSDEGRNAAFNKAGIAPEKRSAAVEWATSALDDVFGWPDVFYTLDAAREARTRFFSTPDGVHLVGLGLPPQFAEEFIAETTPPAPPPGSAPNGASGYHEVVKQKLPLAPGGRALGFELLNVDVGMVVDSWLCNGLEKHCATALGIRPSANGFLAFEDDALRCRAEIERDEVGSEPAPWYPFLLVEY